jgi:hypothetical protein
LLFATFTPFSFCVFSRLTVSIGRVVRLLRKRRQLPVGKGIIAAFPHLLALP